MKVLLQDVGTGNFISGEGDWTASAIEAFDFEQVVQAVDFAMRHGLHSVRVVIKSPGSECDVELPPLPT